MAFDPGFGFFMPVQQPQFFGPPTFSFGTPPLISSIFGGTILDQATQSLGFGSTNNFSGQDTFTPLPDFGFNFGLPQNNFALSDPSVGFNFFGPPQNNFTVGAPATGFGLSQQDFDQRNLVTVLAALQFGL